MAAKIALQLIPLEQLSNQKFDLSQLPFKIMSNVEVADVSNLLPPSMFQHLRDEVGRYRMRFLEATTKHAFAHRYEEQPETPTYEDSVNIAKRNDELLNEVFACSRIIRPTRRHGSVTGHLNADGGVGLEQTSFPDSALDVPEGQKLFAFRNKDIEELRRLIATFLKAMHGDYWPFRMAVQYYYMGYEVNDWKGRYLIIASSRTTNLLEEIVRQISTLARLRLRCGA